jgi:hypothetical protein
MGNGTAYFLAKKHCLLYPVNAVKRLVNSDHYAMTHKHDKRLLSPVEYSQIAR